MGLEFPRIPILMSNIVVYTYLGNEGTRSTVQRTLAIFTCPEPELAAHFWSSLYE